MRIAGWTIAGITALVSLLVGIAAWLYPRADVSTVGALSFENELLIPELDEGDRGDDGVVRFELDVQARTTQFRQGEATDTGGVNGSYLGPTLRASRGDDVEVAVTNGVDEVTTMHWHGMHL